MACFSGALSEGPCVQLECGHIHHVACLKQMLTIRWSGPRIGFGFCKCPICRRSLLANSAGFHPALDELLSPLAVL